MPTTTSYPGVYIDEDASPSFSISSAPSAVPVFIGPFSKVDGSRPPASKCIRIDSWLDFRSIFSFDSSVSVDVTSTLETANLSQSDKNTGTNQSEVGSTVYTYTDKISSYYSPAFDVQSYFQNGGGICYILPLDISSQTELDALISTIEQENEITLLVPLGYTVSDCTKISTTVNSLLADGKDYFLIVHSDDGVTIPTTQIDQTAAYYPRLTTNYYPMRPKDTAIPVTGYVDGTGEIVASLDKLKQINPTYYATVSADIDAASASTIRLSPSAPMAGIYCKTDATRGVWKAPANVVVNSVTGVDTLVSDDGQGSMNDAGINVIRYFPNRGAVVWGARTLAGNSGNSDTSWRYIPVRRLFNSAERDISKALRTMMFEPNNQPTWEKVRSAIENYLHGVWMQGALMGTTPKEAYFVQIGLNITMTPEQVAQGQMITTVGMAAVRPAEFIILKFTQYMDS